MRGQAGFSYVLVMFAVALFAIMAVRLLDVAATREQRAREAELLYIGNAYRAAIGVFYENTPGTVKRYPEKLSDLLQDPRTVTMQRPLRKLYRDPMTNAATWGLVLGPDERITGVYSLSDRQPLKTGGFAPVLAGFARATAYRDWRFVYVPVVTVPLDKPLHKPSN